MTQKNETATLKLERTMEAPAERVYRAFLDPKALETFMSPEGTTTRYEKLEPKVGGAYRYVMEYPGRGGQAFEGEFLVLDEFTRIRFTYRFVTDMPEMQTPMEIEVMFAETDGGTLVTFRQYGIPSAIPVEGARQGWDKMMDALSRYVEQDA